MEVEDRVVDSRPRFSHLPTHRCMATHMQPCRRPWCRETHLLGHVIVSNFSQYRFHMLLPLQVTIGQSRVEVTDDAMRSWFLEIEVRTRAMVIANERPISDAVPREKRESVIGRGGADGVVRLRTTRAVTAETGHGIENRRVVIKSTIIFDRVERPVPVRLCAFVAAFVDECAFVFPDE